MLGLFRKIVEFFNIFKIVFLALILVAIFIFSNGHFIFVKAFNNQINIFPGKFELVSDDKYPVIIWNNVENIFYQDLSDGALLSDFNKTNSANINFPPVCAQAPETGTVESPNPDENGQAAEEAGAGVQNTEDSANIEPEKEQMPAEEPKEEPIKENGEVQGVEEPSSGQLNEPAANESGSQDVPADDTEENALPSNQTSDQPLESIRDMFLGFNSTIYKIISPRYAQAQDKSGDMGADEPTTNNEIRQSLVFDNFTTLLDLSSDQAGNLDLVVSMAGLGQLENDSLVFEYSTGEEWQELGELFLEKQLSNSINGDYYRFPLPAEIGWQQIDKLKIRASYLNENQAGLENALAQYRKEDCVIEPDSSLLSVYIDALWLELNFNGDLEDGSVEEETEEIKVEQVEKNPYSLELLSDKKAFSSREKPELRFKIKKDRSILEMIKSFFVDEYAGAEFKPRLRHIGSNKEMQINLELEYAGDSEFFARILDLPRQFKPGTYELTVDVIKDDINNGQALTFSQEFSWGVLAYNSNKSIYYNGETALLQAAVLDRNGHTICDAGVYIEITAPDGGVAYLDTENGLVIRDPNCQPDSITNVPDYSAVYQVGPVGRYGVKIKSKNGDVENEITDFFEVWDKMPFDIERVGPTRIYPWADYKMLIRIKPTADYSGAISEAVPADFVIKNATVSLFSSSTADYEKLDYFLKETSEGDAKIMNWPDFTMQAGNTYEILYTFDAPNISPEFYLIGPLRLRSGQADEFAELRQWQIASDADIGTVLAQRIPIGPSTADTTNWTNITTATSTNFTGGDKYLVYVSAGFAGSTVTVSADFQIRYGSNVQYTGYIEAPGPANYDSFQITWFDVYDQPSTPTDVAIDFRTNSGTSYALNTQVLAINLSDLDTDDWAYAASSTTYNHTTTMAKRAGITLGNADGAKDWLVMAMDEVQIDSAAIKYQGEIYDNTSSYMGHTAEGENTNDLLPFTIIRTFNDVAANTNYSIRVRDNSAPNSNDSLKSRIFALNLDAFESHKSSYSNPSPDTAISSSPTWTEIGNLNSGGNYAPTTAGDQLIFASWIDNADSGAAGYNDRLQVNNTTVPASWSWAQSSVTQRCTHDVLDEINNNIFSMVSIPTSGQTIDLDAAEITSTSQLADEISLTVFSKKLYTPPAAAPTGAFNSAVEKTDGSGAVDISIEVNDTNMDNCRAKIEYVEGDSCDFLFPFNPTLNTLDASTTADYGDPDIDNNYAYQVGTTTGYIITTSGSNTVDFDWLSKSNLDGADGTYCLRLIANDGTADQTTATTTLVTIDNKAPTAPGTMSAEASFNNIVLTFGASTTETNFSEYRIFYKQGSSGVTENDSEYDAALLDFQDYNGYASTTVTGLTPETQYVFNIWAYDDYGNKASSSEVAIMTGEAEPLRANSVMFQAGAYSGYGSGGQYSDTNHVFDNFNFYLAENAVQIKNAYIIFEATFEAYTNNSGNYSGYNLAFDSCAEPCTADAFTGTGRVLTDDNTVLAYDNTESNQVRLLLDVTDEAQLAAYSGGSGLMEGQIGYRIERGTAVLSISISKAVLVVTYLYNTDESDSYTNTVVYPLESTTSGDSGSRRSSQADDCTLNSNCPTFNYTVTVPELAASLSDWFVTYNVDDAHAGDDVAIDVNIQGSDLNSTTFNHEAALGGTQGNTPALLFESVYGYAQNSAQVLEYHAVNSAGGATYYLNGGEVFETYTASSSETTKTRTVVFPIGTINNGLTTSKTNASTAVFFPENGSADGTVSIKKAWIRIVSNNYASGADTVTVSTKVGDNAESGDWIYSYNPGSTIVNPVFSIVHVIPSADYAELESANAITGKTVAVYTTNNSAAQGGTSAELVITYSYTGESDGYLANLNLFAGQTATNGNSQLENLTSANTIFPEITGTKTLLAAGLNASYLISDSDGGVANANLTLEANLATGTPDCTNAYNAHPDAINSYAQFYKSVISAMDTTDNASYTACYSNDGAGDSSAGGKMNGQLVYTYKWDAPPPVYTQNDWRWYETYDGITPTIAKADENTAISGINKGESLRLRLNAGITSQNLSTSTRIFKLQYGKGIDCDAVTDWADVGAIGSGVAWEGYDNSSVADGASTSNALLASSTVFESYEEENNSIANPRAIAKNAYGEWDWSLYNKNASSTADYCFRMIKSDDTDFDFYNSDGYPILTTAASNTPPNAAYNLGQYKSDGVTPVANMSWMNQQIIEMTARATDTNIDEIVGLYFQVIPNNDSFTTATTAPASFCYTGTDYGDCPSKIWAATSTAGDYRVNPYIGTTTVTGLPQNYIGYKWQVIACDDEGDCSAWAQFAAGPNFKIDITPPDPPGNLLYESALPTTITVAFGASSTEDNFLEYKIFFKKGSSGVTELDTESDDPDLDFQDYHDTGSTTISGLSTRTQYVINIWAYDLAGNKATATVELVASTESSYTPPTGSIVSAVQKKDGSGVLDMAILADDNDNDDTLRAKIEYVEGTGCNFSSSNQATIDETDENITATYGDPDADNSYLYQVGATSSWIMTSPGSNYVFFDWQSKSDIPAANGTYCIRLTVNDSLYDQGTPHMYLKVIDNVDPVAPGPLTLNSKNSTSITVDFGTPGSDARFEKYRIFYSTTSPAMADDHEHLDDDLLDPNYSTTATTTISGLEPNTTYYINIWAFDLMGNNASATPPLMVTTNNRPDSIAADGQYKADEATRITNGGWTNESEVRLSARATDPDTSEVLNLYYQFIAATGTFIIATTVPANPCADGTAYGSCASKVWKIASAAGDYSAAPYIATTSITTISDNSTGYKWQVLACDDDGDCTDNWSKFDLSSPNLKVDTTPPTAPGNLTEDSNTSSNITLNFGATTTESNFLEYRIYYSDTSPVDETDSLFSSTSDAHLANILFSGAATTTIAGLSPNVTYFINIWAYDQAGNKANATQVAITTATVASTPGVLFYAKNNRVLYYQVWTGSAWGTEQAGPNMGSGAAYVIRNLEAIRSDDGSRVAILAKSWDGTRQQWWGTVYRVAANDFVNTSQLGGNEADNTNNTELTGCIGSLSGGEFIVVRTNNGNDGSLVYSWNATVGWTAEAAGPSPLAVLNGCKLVRRPNTDNYILITFDDDSDVGTSYYYGGPTFVNNWTSWSEHSAEEDSVNNFTGDAFFDPSDNTRGAVNYTGANNQLYTYAKKFLCSDNSINFGSSASSPQSGTDDWNDDFVHGEFAADPGGTGIAYFAGRDITENLNIYKVDATSTAPLWTTVTNGDDISGGALYDDANFAQKPFGIMFYRDNYAVAAWNENTSLVPKYRVVNAASDTVDASNTAVPGSSANIWTRVKLYKDPLEDELLAVYQNDDIDYAAAFWDGWNHRFYNSTDNPGSSQVFTELVTASGGANANYQLTSFAYTAGNQTPSTPTALLQYQAVTNAVLANGDWTSTSTVKFQASAADPDTSEIIVMYLQLVANNDTLATGSTKPASACATTISFNDCASQIWQFASSTAGDYSVAPYTATSTIYGIPDSSAGYKWQIMACDDGNRCSSWTKYNATAPNFKVDKAPPDAPGALTISAVTSTSVTLTFGASTTEPNFRYYRIFYKQAASGATEADTEWTDTDLNFKNYNNTTNTVVSGLASSTQYVFNIWAYDWAGNKATATPEVATTTASGPWLRLKSYLLENDDGLTVNDNTSDAAVDTQLSNLNKGERYNARFQIENLGGDTASAKIYKLQYENYTDAAGTWIDVGAATDIRYVNAISGTSGNVISSYKAAYNANAWLPGYWYENTNVTGSFNLNKSSFTEFVFAVDTANASLGKTYRLRLYNNTDSRVLDGYTSTSTVSIIGTETKRYSKGSYAALPATNAALLYYLDPQGYDDVSGDNGIRDIATSSLAYNVINFTTKHTNNTDAITVTWNGQSSVAGADSTIYLQVYNNTAASWVTVASNATSTVDSDFTITGNINYQVSKYYDASNFTYWRLYQATATGAIRTDYLNAAFSAPVSYIGQNHYRWRNDNGTQTTATWREAEDNGDPTDPTAPITKFSNIRLRMEFANTGGGTATDYQYRLEYATTTGDCSTDPGYWNAVPTDYSGHWHMSTSTNFTNHDATTNQLANSESYTFTAGSMIQYPNSTSSAVTLTESRFTEIEYNLYATANAADGGTYCFRATNNGTVLNSYSRYPVITIFGTTNTAPSWTIYPSDDGSATDTPTDYGANVYFSATAQDPESDDYYLAVCKTNSITAGNNTAPTCGGGSWCVSNAASSTLEANCTYNAVAASEKNDWFAYLCDKRAGFSVAKCSAVSQGNDYDKGSPFVINHLPVFTSVSTTVDNQDPGGTFTISSVSYDNDSLGANDTLSFFVCSENNADYSGCKSGVTICSAVATSSPNAKCYYTDTAPTPANANTYYSFLFDNHGLAATANSRSSTYTIKNVAPTLGEQILNGGADLYLNLKGAGDKAVSTINASVQDWNGCATGLVSATAVVYMSNATGGYSCAQNDNDCYQITTANCIKSDCTDDDDATAIYTCTAELKYFAVPTDSYSLTNPWKDYNWLSRLQVFDGLSYIASTSAGIEINTNIGLEVPEATIDFGSEMYAGEDTGTRNSTTTVNNIGNSPIDSSLSGIDMVGTPSGTIFVNNIKWSLAENFNYQLAGITLDYSGITADTITPRATTNATSTDQVFWGIGIPFASDASSYNGINTFTVILDSDNWTP